MISKAVVWVFFFVYFSKNYKVLNCIHKGSVFQILKHIYIFPSLLPQVFVGKIPRDLYEDELVPLFESAGPIWDLRLMMDPLSGQNRGYAFITYCNKDDAQKAVKLVSGLAGTISPYLNSSGRLLFCEMDWFT